MPKAYDFVPSVVDPMEWHLLVRFASDRLESAVASPARLTTYADIDLPEKPCLGQTRNGKEVSTWVLTKMERVEEGWTQFRFVPPKTRAEQERSPFDTGWTQRPYRWPAFITEPVFTVKTEYPRVAEDKTGVFYLPRGDIYIDFIQSPAEGFWPVKVEKFVSPQAFERPKSHRPLHRRLVLDYYGARIDMECLHPGFAVPQQNEPGRRSGGAAVAGKTVPERLVSPTNFQRWAPFTFRNEPEFVESEGVWFVQRETIYPPSMQEGAVS